MVHSKICSYLLQEEGASIELTLVRQQEQQLSASVQASPHNGDRGENKRKRIKQKRSPERYLPRLFPTPVYSSLDAAAIMPKPA